MVSARETHRHGVVCRIISTVLTVVFTFGVIYPPYIAEAQVMPMLPLPGTMVMPTNGYMPTMIKGIEVHPENPLEFNFIIDTGDTNLTGQALHDESIRLIKYFLASLTVPADQLWVNLSPYEGDRIIPDRFGATEMGRDLLAQDYILKQLTASLMYPEQELGKKFWDRVYERAQKEFGTTDIAMDSFHKVWIVPDQADVFQKGNHAFVMRSHLKVMLEEDYLAARINAGAPVPQNPSAPERNLTGEQGNRGTGEPSKLQTEIMREVIIPEIEKEVNQGQTFSQLRQIYQAMILATWFKKNLKESLLGQIYVDQNKVKGVDTDPAHKQKIYEQYVQAFEKGVYNYIKEEVDPVSKQVVPRNYFSGGYAGPVVERIQKTVNGDDNAMLSHKDRTAARAAMTPDGKTLDLGVNLLEDRDPQHLAAALPKITVPGGFDVTVTGVSEKNGRKVYTLSWAVPGMANKIEPVKGVEFSFNGSAEKALEAVRARMDSIQRSGSRALDSVWDVSPLNRHLANFSAEDLTEFWKNQVAVIQDRVLDPISQEQSDVAMLAFATGVNDQTVGKYLSAIQWEISTEDLGNDEVTAIKAEGKASERLIMALLKEGLSQRQVEAIITRLSPVKIEGPIKSKEGVTFKFGFELKPGAAIPARELKEAVNDQTVAKYFEGLPWEAIAVPGRKVTSGGETVDYPLIAAEAKVRDRLRTALMEERLDRRDIDEITSRLDIEWDESKRETTRGGAKLTIVRLSLRPRANKWTAEEFKTVLETIAERSDVFNQIVLGKNLRRGQTREQVAQGMLEEYLRKVWDFSSWDVAEFLSRTVITVNDETIPGTTVRKMFGVQLDAVMDARRIEASMADGKVSPVALKKEARDGRDVCVVLHNDKEAGTLPLEYLSGKYNDQQVAKAVAPMISGGVAQALKGGINSAAFKKYLSGLKWNVSVKTKGWTLPAGVDRATYIKERAREKAGLMLDAVLVEAGLSEEEMNAIDKRLTVDVTETSWGKEGETAFIATFKLKDAAMLGERAVQVRKRNSGTVWVRLVRSTKYDRPVAAVLHNDEQIGVLPLDYLNPGEHNDDEVAAAVRSMIGDVAMLAVDYSVLNPQDAQVLQGAEQTIAGILKTGFDRGDFTKEIYERSLANSYRNLAIWTTDPDIHRLSPGLRKANLKAIREGRWEDIIEAYRGEVPFGTAGIRGFATLSQEELLLLKEYGPSAAILKGPNTINDVTLMKKTQAVIDMMKKNGQTRVQIGYDSRVAGQQFAEMIARQFIAASTPEHMFTIYLFDEASPFPELSFGVTTEEAKSDWGLFISASHNPRRYNGFKITRGNGAQLNQKAKEEVLASDAKVRMSDIKLANSLADAKPGQLIWLGGDKPLEGKDYHGFKLIDMHTLHIEQVKSFLLDKELIAEYGPKVKIGFSAYNGSGYKAVPRLLREAGFTNFKVVSKLQVMDGMFPAFNPEEQPDPGDPIAADVAAREFIAEHGQSEFDDLDVLKGTDPDADRLGQTYRVPEDQQKYLGKYRLLAANDVWTLLIWYRLMKKKEMGILDPAKSRLVFSHATSDALEAVGELFGVASIGDMMDKTGTEARGGYLDGRRTWVGFTYIGDWFEQLAEEGLYAEAGAEESNGFSIGGHVLDKDGTFAAILMAEVEAHAKKQGITVIELLDDIYRQIGFYATANKPLPRIGAFKGAAGVSEKIKMVQKAEQWMKEANERAGTDNPLMIAGREVIGAVSFGSNRVDGLHYKDIPDEGIRFFFKDEVNVKPGDPFTKSKNYVMLRISGTSQTIRAYTQLWKPFNVQGEEAAKLKAQGWADAEAVSLITEGQLIKAVGLEGKYLSMIEDQMKVLNQNVKNLGLDTTMTSLETAGNVELVADAAMLAGIAERAVLQAQDRMLKTLVESFHIKNNSDSKEGAEKLTATLEESIHGAEQTIQEVSDSLQAPELLFQVKQELVQFVRGIKESAAGLRAKVDRMGSDYFNPADFSRRLNDLEVAAQTLEDQILAIPRTAQEVISAETQGADEAMLGEKVRDSLKTTAGRVNTLLGQAAKMDAQELKTGIDGIGSDIANIGGSLVRIQSGSVQRAVRDAMDGHAGNIHRQLGMLKRAAQRRSAELNGHVEKLGTMIETAWRLKGAIKGMNVSQDRAMLAEGAGLAAFLDAAKTSAVKINAAYQRISGDSVNVPFTKRQLNAMALDIDALYEQLVKAEGVLSLPEMVLVDRERDAVVRSLEGLQKAMKDLEGAYRSARNGFPSWSEKASFEESIRRIEEDVNGKLEAVNQMLGKVKVFEIDRKMEAWEQQLVTEFMKQAEAYSGDRRSSRIREGAAVLESAFEDLVRDGNVSGLVFSQGEVLVQTGKHEGLQRLMQLFEDLLGPEGQISLGAGIVLAERQLKRDPENSKYQTILRELEVEAISTGAGQATDEAMLVLTKSSKDLVRSEMSKLGFPATADMLVALLEGDADFGSVLHNALGEKEIKDRQGRQYVADSLSTLIGELKGIVQFTNKQEAAETVSVADQAMVTSRQPEDIKGTRKVGGIDLNPAFLDLKIKRDGNGIPLPIVEQPMQELMQIEGFVPVIINVTPVQNLPMLLGMDVEPTTDDQNEGYAKLSFYKKVDVYEHKFIREEMLAI